jgi:hypothetical protein
MPRRVAHQVGRPQAQQPDPQAQRDAAVDPGAERTAPPGLWDGAAARPQINRQERVTFTV